MKNATRTAIYVRLSVHRGDDDPSTSPETQERACREYASVQGWAIDHVVKDLDVSGAAGLDRPGLRELRRLGVERVLFLKLDRISRSVSDFLALSREFQLVSVRDNLDMATPTGRFVATLLASFAELEREMIAGRVQDSRSALAKRRRFGGGTPPFGYDSAPGDDGGRVLVVNYDESTLLKQAALQILAGHSLTKIARRWNEAGVKSRRGKSWSPSTLGEMLRRPALVGRMTHGGKVVVGEDGLPEQVWPEAVPVALWRSMVERLDQNTPEPGKTPRRAGRLLSGVIVCSGCGKNLTARNYAKGAAYQCGTRSQGGTCPQPVSMLAEWAETALESHLLRAAGHLPVFETEAVGDPEAEQKLRDAQEALQAVVEGFLDPSADVATLVAERARLVPLVEQYRVQAQQVTTRQVETGETLSQAWSAAGDMEKRSLLLDRLERVELLPAAGRKYDEDRVLPVWKQ